MPIDRRHLLTASAGAVAALAFPRLSVAASFSALGLNASDLGLRADATDDQSALFQRAIDQAARARVPLLLPPGTYRARELRLPSFAKLIGIGGATRVLLSGRGSLLASERADNIELSGLILDGADTALPKNGSLVDLSRGAGLKISDCTIINVRGASLALDRMAGSISQNQFSAIADTAIHSIDAGAMIISANTVKGIGNNGIRVWRSETGPDGTLVADNRIENIRADAGGDGQNGNAINVFRAGNVIVRGNQIRKSAFSAIRSNGGSNLQIINNTCSDLGEVALYSEFGFQGALIANNIVDGAVVGVSVTNYNDGGRLAVVQGNILRNLGSKADPKKGIGIGVEADTIVSGNVIEKAPMIGIGLGYGPYLRDVSVTGNIVREAGIGIAVSVAPGAGAALISDNLIADFKRGAIIGMEWEKVVTGDLARDGAGKYAQLSISGNRLR